MGRLVTNLRQQCEALQNDYDTVLKSDDNKKSRSASLNPLLTQIVIEIDASYVIWKSLGDNPKTLTGDELSKTKYDDRDRVVIHTTVYLMITTSSGELSWSIYASDLDAQPLRRQPHLMSNIELVNFIELIVEGPLSDGFTSGLDSITRISACVGVIPLPVINVIFSLPSAGYEGLCKLARALRYFELMPDDLMVRCKELGMFSQSKSASIQTIIDSEFPEHDTLKDFVVYYDILGDSGLRAFCCDFGVPIDTRVARCIYLLSLIGGVYESRMRSVHFIRLAKEQQAILKAAKQKKESKAKGTSLRSSDLKKESKVKKRRTKS